MARDEIGTRRRLGATAGLLLLALAGCSAAPTKSSAPTAPSPAPSPVSAAAAAVPTTSAPAPAAASPAAAGAQAPGKTIPSGYRLVKRNGKDVYCRSVTTIGSRFAEEMCFTREQLEEIVERTDSAMGDLEQSMKVCSGSGACGTR